MEHEVIGARGEVALRAGGQDLVIAATMKGLSAVSTHLECKSLADLFVRLTHAEVAATEAGIMFLTVKGDGAKAAENLRLADFNACSEAFTKALAHHFDGQKLGNGLAAKTAAKG